MTDLHQLRRLSKITETALSVAQAEMLKLRKQEAALRKQLLDISDTAQKRPETDSAAYRAGADVRWQRWVDKRREEINFELARVLARKDSAKSRLRKAFGKDQAIQMLVLKLHTHERRNKSQHDQN